MKKLVALALGALALPAFNSLAFAAVDTAPKISTGEAVGAFATIFGLFAVSVFLYLLPAFIAWRRHHNNRVAIFCLNFFLGWSLFGWVAALVWAFTNQTPQVIVVDKADVTNVTKN